LIQAEGHFWFVQDYSIRKLEWSTIFIKYTIWICRKTTWSTNRLCSR